MQEIYRFIDDAIEADRQRYTDIADRTSVTAVSGGCRLLSVNTARA